MNKSESKYFNTAKKMNDALIAILKTKAFEYITIKEVCEKAQVNRSTFYLHYENTVDLLNETTRNLINDFLSYFPDETSNISRRFLDCDLSELNFITEKYLHPYLSYIKDNKQVFFTILTHTSSFDCDKVYQRMFENIFDPILERFNYPKGHRKYAMMFYMRGINAIITEWLKDDCVKTIEEITGIIQSCIFGLQ